MPYGLVSGNATIASDGEEVVEGREHELEDLLSASLEVTSGILSEQPALG